MKLKKKVVTEKMSMSDGWKYQLFAFKAKIHVLLLVPKIRPQIFHQAEVKILNIFSLFDSCSLGDIYSQFF